MTFFGKEEQNKDIQKEALRWVKENKGYKIKGGDFYDSPRISSELMDCSMPMTFDHLNFCSLGCTYCMTSGTKILMENGREKSIERIREGERVLSYDTVSKKSIPSVVTKTMKRKKTKEIVELELNNGIHIKLTLEHPVFVRKKGWTVGWIEAGKLTTEDEVLLW